MQQIKTCVYSAICFFGAKDFFHKHLYGWTLITRPFQGCSRHKGVEYQRMYNEGAIYSRCNRNSHHAHINVPKYMIIYRHYCYFISCHHIICIVTIATDFFSNHIMCLSLFLLFIMKRLYNVNINES